MLEPRDQVPQERVADLGEADAAAGTVGTAGQQHVGEHGHESEPQQHRREQHADDEHYAAPPPPPDSRMNS